MPLVTYKGPEFYRRSPDVYHPDFTRGEVREVSQAWLDKHRRRLVEPYFILEGDEPPHVDAGNDGIPDASWRRKEIIAWLSAYDVELPGAYYTKSALLGLVDTILSPEAPQELEALEEEAVEAEAEVEAEVEAEEIAEITE